VRRTSVRITGLAAVLVALAACGGPASPDESAAGNAIRRQTSSGPTTVEVAVDRTSIEAGERIEVAIEVTTDPAVTVTMPELTVEAPLEIVQSTTPPDVPDGAVRRWRHVHVVTSYEPGEVALPAITVDAATPGGRAETLTIDPIDLTIASVLEPDEADAIPELRETAAVDLPRHVPWWWYAIAGLGAALVVVAGLAAIRWMTRPHAAPPPPPPHERALAALRDLAAAGLLDRGEIAPYYERLSWIVRTYLEERYGIMAPERTTKEFLRDAAQHPALGPDDRNELASFLRAADMAKFAKFQPPRTESESALEAARRFVERTTPAAKRVAEAPEPADPPDDAPEPEGAA